MIIDPNIIRQDALYSRRYGYVYKQVRLVTKRGDCFRAMNTVVEHNDNRTLLCEGINGNYYLKVGSIVQSRKCNFMEQFYDFKQFGNYLTMNRNSGKLMTHEVFMEERESNEVIIGINAPISDIMPRYDTYDQNVGPVVINCMRIYCSDKKNDKKIVQYKDRSWGRSAGSDWKQPDPKVCGLGFEQLTVAECQTELQRISGINDKSYIGIYVPKNTSLVMNDTVVSFNQKDNTRHDRTLFQEGSVVILENIELEFNFYNKIEYPSGSYEIKCFNFKDLKLEEIHNLQEKDQSRLIYILKPVLTEAMDNINGYNARQPIFSLWCLKVTHIRNKKSGKKVAVLQIPLDTYIEAVYEWNEGITHIGDKMGENPWNRYTCIKDQEPNQYFRLNEFTVPYPGYERNNPSDTNWVNTTHGSTIDRNYIPLISSSTVISDDEPDPLPIDDELRDFINDLYKYNPQPSGEHTEQTLHYPTFDEWTKPSPDQSGSQPT